MSTPTVHDMLRREIDTLPLALAEEVFDFVLFVKARRAEETFLWQQVEETRTYRQQHPDEVTTVKSDEWESLTAHLDDES